MHTFCSYASLGSYSEVIIWEFLKHANLCKNLQEDFHTLTYGFKMAGDETDAAVMSPVKELEEELGRIVKV